MNNDNTDRRALAVAVARFVIQQAEAAGLSRPSVFLRALKAANVWLDNENEAGKLAGELLGVWPPAQNLEDV